MSMWVAYRISNNLVVHKGTTGDTPVDQATFEQETVDTVGGNVGDYGYWLEENDANIANILAATGGVGVTLSGSDVDSYDFFQALSDFFGGSPVVLDAVTDIATSLFSPPDSVEGEAITALVQTASVPVPFIIATFDSSHDSFWRLRFVRWGKYTIEYRSERYGSAIVDYYVECFPGGLVESRDNLLRFPPKLVSISAELQADEALAWEVTRYPQYIDSLD